MHSHRFLLPIRDFLLAPKYKAGDAVIGFYLLGPLGRPAIPALMDGAITSSEDKYALACIESLCAIGPDAVPTLLTVSGKTQSRRHEYAIRCLEVLANGPVK
jgi:hypothetical protein